MGMKNWPHQPGTCRALIWAQGRHVIVCRACKRAVEMPPIDRQCEPCPFVCRYCGARGEIFDPADVPAYYIHQTWPDGHRTYVPPKLRWKPTR